MVQSAAHNETIVVEEGRHSKRGASGSSRWLNCPGSINLADKLYDAGTIFPSSNRAAAEGTAAHLVLSSCMEDGTDAEDMRDMRIEVNNWTFVVEDEMIAGVQESLDWLRGRIAKAKAEGFEVEVYVERGMESFTDPEVYGTGDVIIHIVNDRLIIYDFKYGAGITVEPWSEQNSYYGYLAVENYVDDPDSLKVVESWIGQPRIPHANGTIRRHVTNVKELTDWWFGEVLPGIQATRDPHAHLVIGDWCKWCPAKDHCPALKKEGFEFPTGIDPDHVTDDELGDLLNKLDALANLKPSLEAEALRRARNGAKIRHRKLVRKLSRRQFRDTMTFPNPDNPDEPIVKDLKTAVTEQFGMDAYSDPELKTPPQLEKMEGGGEFVAKWAYTPDEGTTLAKASDRRPEILPNIQRVRGRVKGEFKG
jgi:hypothetical protein